MTWSNIVKRYAVAAALAALVLGWCYCALVVVGDVAVNSRSLSADLSTR